MEANDYENETVISVYQCRKCSSIVADSLGLLNREILTFQNIPQCVIFDKKIHLSTKKYDYGCTYKYFVCQKCEQVLGKYYIATTSVCDDLKDKYTFDRASISTYNLGCYGSDSLENSPNFANHNNKEEYIKKNSIHKEIDHLQSMIDDCKSSLNNGYASPIKPIPYPLSPRSIKAKSHGMIESSKYVDRTPLISYNTNTMDHSSRALIHPSHSIRTNSYPSPSSKSDKIDPFKHSTNQSPLKSNNGNNDRRLVKNYDKSYGTNKHQHINDMDRMIDACRNSLMDLKCSSLSSHSSHKR